MTTRQLRPEEIREIERHMERAGVLRAVVPVRDDLGEREDLRDHSAPRWVLDYRRERASEARWVMVGAGLAIALIGAVAVLVEVFR